MMKPELQTAPALGTSRTKMDKMVREIIEKKAETTPDGKAREVMIDVGDIFDVTDGVRGAIDVRLESVVSEHIDYFYAIFRESENPNVPAIYVEWHEDANGKVYFVVIEGRHRTAGARKAGRKQIRAVIFYDLTDVERRVLALYGNLRVGLKMGSNDLAANVFKFLKMGIDKGEIRGLMSGVPKFDLEKAIKWGSRDYNRTQLNAAINENAKGNKTLRQIADDYQVSFKRLQRAVEAKKRGTGTKGRADDPIKVAGHIALEFKKFRTYLDNTAGELIQQSDKNVVPAESVSALFKKMRGHINTLTERVALAEGKLRSIQFEEGGRA